MLTSHQGAQYLVRLSRHHSSGRRWLEGSAAPANVARCPNVYVIILGYAGASKVMTRGPGLPTYLELSQCRVKWTV